jgi:hypothetical protein
VRVFLDEPTSLSSLSARIDPSLWVQPLANYELWRSRLAEAIAPAEHVVCMSGAKVPERYLERIAYGASQHRQLIRLLPLGQTAPGPNAPPLSVPSGAILDVVQDDSADGVGVIRAVRSTAEMRARWKGQLNLTHATLEGLGITGMVECDTLVVLCWGVAIADPRKLCQMLSHSQARHTLLLVGQSCPESKAGQHGSRALAVAGNGQRTSVLELPPLTWSQLDELVWISDLALCGTRDMAHRAMEAGTPMLWLGEDVSLLDWYFAEFDPAYKRLLAAAAYQFRTTGSLTSELVWYFGQSEWTTLVARKTAQRIAHSKSLAESLPEVPLRRTDALKRQHESRRNSIEPTSPMSLPD